MSVGKLPASATTTRRPGRRLRPACSALWMLIVVVSLTTTSPGPAPITGAIRSPSRVGSSNQPAVFQLLISPSAHSRSAASAAALSAASGAGPSELPSR